MPSEALPSRVPNARPIVGGATLAGHTKEREQAIRAARSHTHNREPQHKVAERPARAENLLQTYLMQTGPNAPRLGSNEIVLHDGQIKVTPAPPDGREYEKIG